MLCTACVHNMPSPMPLRLEAAFLLSLKTVSDSLNKIQIHLRLDSHQNDRHMVVLSIRVKLLRIVWMNSEINVNTVHG